VPWTHNFSRAVFWRIKHHLSLPHNIESNVPLSKIMSNDPASNIICRTSILTTDYNISEVAKSINGKVRKLSHLILGFFFDVIWAFIFWIHTPTHKTKDSLWNNKNNIQSNYSNNRCWRCRWTHPRTYAVWDLRNYCWGPEQRPNEKTPGKSTWVPATCDQYFDFGSCFLCGQLCCFIWVRIRRNDWTKEA